MSKSALFTVVIFIIGLGVILFLAGLGAVPLIVSVSSVTVIVVMFTRKTKPLDELPCKAVSCCHFLDDHEDNSHQ